MEKLNLELGKREIQLLLNSLQFQIDTDLGILFDEKHDPAGECFCVILENLNELANLYVSLKALIPNDENDFGECPYKGKTADGREICTLTYKPTNNAVQCSFEYENCDKFIKRRAAE